MTEQDARLAEGRSWHWLQGCQSPRPTAQVPTQSDCTQGKGCSKLTVTGPWGWGRGPGLATWRGDAMQGTPASDSQWDLVKSEAPSSPEIPRGKPFVSAAPANFQNAFCSLPRRCSPSAAHRGPILCRPEARDELRGRGCGVPPKCRQCAHLRLRVLVLRAGPWGSQVCNSRPSHCCQQLCPVPVCATQTFLDFMYL